MLLCAGVLEPVTRGKGTKRDQTPFLAQHNELGMGTEMFMVPAQGIQGSSFTADVGQERRECSASSVPSHTLCFLQNSLWNREGGALVSEGSLCPCTEPDDDHGSTATAGSGRAFPQVGLEKLLPQRTDQVRALQS